MDERYYQDEQGIFHRQFAVAHKPAGPGGGQFVKGGGTGGGGGALPVGTHKMPDGKIHMNPAPGQSALGASSFDALKGHVKKGDEVQATTRNSKSINGTVSHVADGKLHLTGGTGGATHIGPEHNVVTLHVTPKGGTNQAEGPAHAGNAGGLKAAGSGKGAIPAKNETPSQARGRMEANKVKDGEHGTVTSVYGTDSGRFEHGAGHITVHTAVGTHPRIDHGEIHSVKPGATPSSDKNIHNDGQGHRKDVYTVGSGGGK